MATGAWIGALVSFWLGHVNLEGGDVDWGACEVRAKAKTFRTYFMLVGEGALGILAEWVHEFERDHLWAARIHSSPRPI